MKFRIAPKRRYVPKRDIAIPHAEPAAASTNLRARPASDDYAGHHDAISGL